MKFKGAHSIIFLAIIIISAHAVAGGRPGITRTISTFSDEGGPQFIINEDGNVIPPEELCPALLTGTDSGNSLSARDSGDDGSEGPYFYDNGSYGPYGP